MRVDSRRHHADPKSTSHLTQEGQLATQTVSDSRIAPAETAARWVRRMADATA